MPTALKTYGGAIKKKKRKLLPRAIRLHVGQQPSPYTVFEALRADNIRKCKNEYKNSKKENHNHCGMAHSKRKMSPDKFVPVGDSTVLFKSPELNSTFDKLFKGPVLQPSKPNRLPNTHGSLSNGSSSENHNFSSSYSMPSSESPSFLGFPDEISTARPPRPFTRHQARQLKLHYTPPETVENIKLPVAALESMVPPSVKLHRNEKNGTSYNDVSMGYIQSKHSPLNSLSYNVPTPVSSKMGLRREALKQNADNYLDLKYKLNGISEKTSKVILEGKNDTFIVDISPFLLQPNKNVTSTPKDFLAPTQICSTMPISAGSSSIKLVKCSSNREATCKTYLQTGNHDKPVDMLISDKSMEVSTNRQNFDNIAKLQSTRNFARISSVCGQIDSNHCINTHSSKANNDPDNLCLEESSSKSVSLINCSDDMFESYEVEHVKLPEETHKENLPSEDLPIYVTRRKATCIKGLDDSMVCLGTNIENSISSKDLPIQNLCDITQTSMLSLPVSPETEVLHLRTRDVTRTKYNNLKNSAKSTKTSGFKKKSSTTRLFKEVNNFKTPTPSNSNKELQNSYVTCGFLEDMVSLVSHTSNRGSKELFTCSPKIKTTEKSLADINSSYEPLSKIKEALKSASHTQIKSLSDESSNDVSNYLCVSNINMSISGTLAHNDNLNLSNPIMEIQSFVDKSLSCENSIRPCNAFNKICQYKKITKSPCQCHLDNYIKDALEESAARSSVHLTDVLEESLARSSVHIKDVQDILEESLARSSLHITDVQDVLEESLARSSVHITDVQDVLEESVARSSVHITDVQDVLEESLARISVHITDVQDVLEESVARSSVHITDVQDVLEESVARSSVHITDVQDVLEESLARSSVYITDVQDVLEESVAKSIHITDCQDVLEESVARSSVHITDVQDVLEESVARGSVHITDVQDVLEDSVARSSIHGTDNSHIHTKKLQSTEERKISLEYTLKKTYQPQSPKSMRRKRCTRLVIAGRDSSQNLSRQSIFKDVCCSFNGTFARSSINEEGTILKLEPALSNASVNLLDSPTQSEEVLHSACDVVLSKCHLKRILLFSDAFSFSFLDKCSKIGEGVYGEVFSCEESCSVIKIIPIEGNQLVNGEPQKTFKEILSEIVITIELSNLRCNQYNTTSAFTEVLRCLCVQGRYPHRLIELWNIYAEKKGTENDSPEMFDEDQLFIILELTHGGTDLESYHFQSAEQAFSVYQQVAHALAVAECSLEFEHRDLHWGNILISPTRDTISRFCIRGKQIDVATKGVKVTIIDFTLSRMTYEGCHIFNDLSVDESLFTAQGDYQFEMYRLMRSAVKDDWSTFVPKTNLFWLHYLLDKICTLVHYKRKTTKVHKEYIKRARNLFKSILRFDSVTQCVNSVEC